VLCSGDYRRKADRGLSSIMFPFRHCEEAFCSGDYRRKADVAISISVRGIASLAEFTLSEVKCSQ